MKSIKIYLLKSFVLLTFITLFSNYTYAQPSRAINTDGFRAAVVKVNVTPQTPQWLRGYDPRQSTGVLDSIYHRIVALDDGKNQFFLISTDVCLFSPAFYDDVAARIEDQLGISPMNLWWSTTHTHSAPVVSPNYPGIAFPHMAQRRAKDAQHEIDNDYTVLLEQKLIEGIIDAQSKLEPARLGVGWGFSQANINRRAIDVDGKASLGLNPDGPVDRRIGILRIDKEDGTPLTCIANYPIHGTVMGQENQLISGDAPGVVSDYFEQKIGVPLLFINGAAGNIAPIYSVYPSARSGHLSEFRVLLGDKIIDAYEKILSTTDEVKLNTGSLIVETPQAPELEFPEVLSKYTTTSDAGLKLAKLPIRFLKINEDIAVWSAPVELFCEISNEIRERSPFAYTFYFGYTNGSFGYLTTENAYKHKGYEPSVSPFTPRAQSDLTEAVLNYLQGRNFFTWGD